MRRIFQLIHDNQLVASAAILFLAVLVYCLFNRYDYVRGDTSFVIDHLTGNLHSIRNCIVRKPVPKNVP